MDLPTDLHIVLLAPEIPWNTGNIGRTCLAAGACLHLVRPLGFSLDERRVRRAGLDYWDSVEPRLWDSWSGLEEQLPSLGQPTFFSAEGTAIWGMDLGSPAVLVFGSETSGLPPEIRRRYRARLAAIPMARGPVRSLNLSNAVAVAVFEALRRKWNPGT